MRYMLIARATAETEAEASPDPDPVVLAEMATHHDELTRAGVLPGDTHLHPSRRAWRVRKGGAA